MAVEHGGCLARELGFRPFMGLHPYGWIFQLAILVALGAVIFWVIRGNKTETALDIVKKRYAKGDITEKEFKKISKELV